MKKRFVILTIAFLSVFFLSFFLGRYSVYPIQALKILFNRFLELISRGNLSLATTWTGAEEAIVLNVRFPRIVAAALIGAALSVAGVSYQGMFRNPMVSPDLLGASTGSGFGAALAILLGGSYFAISVSSFFCGLVAVFLAFQIGKTGKAKSTIGLVLAGVMVSSLFQSGTSFIKIVADTQSQLPAITYWLMGSLASVKNRDVLFAFIPILLGLIPLILLRWRINLLTVSEAEARSMGVETGKLRAIVIICATLMTAASVSISGMIGWVGLVIPHFCRIWFGQDYRRLIPSCALLGATFLMVVDNLSRLISTAEIPLGILTSFVGAPVFIFLILKGSASYEH